MSIGEEEVRPATVTEYNPLRQPQDRSFPADAAATVFALFARSFSLIMRAVNRRLILRLTLAILLTVAVVRGARAQTLADTPENRHAQAQRYLQATPPRQLFAEMARNLSASMPAAQRDKVVAMFTTNLDVDGITKGMEDALVKRFTAEELKAMADFYGSPVGKSIQSKMSDYLTDLMPLTQAQMMKSLSGGNPGK